MVLMRKVSSRGEAGRGECARVVAFWKGTGVMEEVESFAKADTEDEVDASDTLCDRCFLQGEKSVPTIKFSLSGCDLEEIEPEAGLTRFSRVRREVYMIGP